MVMIGLEVHVQLNTRSKLFCGNSTNSKDKLPNEETCPVCLGFPGSKPVLNKRALDLGLTIALALNCTPNHNFFFSRKTYFYPDMSKNFQITQYEAPIGVNGHVNMNGSKIRIKRIHIEEDPARLVYVGGDITTAKYTLIDYNRSGVPLAEIVTEPDFTTPQEARAFLEKLASIVEHLDAYDSREGTLRVDANVSIEGGNRIEIKNITGFENVEKALTFEIIRQKGMVRMGVEVQRETRHFDADERTTKGLRKKETEEDYGYIFDPDLPTISIDESTMAGLKQSMPELPDHRIARFVREMKLPEYSARVIVYSDKHLADFFEDCLKLYSKPEETSNWIINYLLKSLNWRSERISDSKVRPETFVEFLRLIDEGKITERYAKELIKEYVDTGESPKALAEKSKVQISNGRLQEIVAGVLKSNAKASEEVRKGETKSLQFLIGEVLKQTRKQADPKLIKDVILQSIKEK